MAPLGATGLTLLGLTIIVAFLVAVLAFAVLRFSAAARDSRSNLRESRTETALLSAALEEAIGKLKAQERATAARAEASERLNSEIVASLTSGLLVVHRSGVVQIVNPAARRILGLPDAAAGQEFRQLLSLMPALADVIAKGLESNSPIVRRRVALDHPGGPSCLGVTVSPLAAATGTQEAVVCLFTDLTAVTALEEQLRLKEALARLGELTAGLAHEFRNGLATIHGYARLLDPAMLPEVYRPYVDGIRGETQAMGEVVTNFLNFARPEPLTLAPLDLGDVIRRAVDDMPDGFAVSVTGDFGRIDGDEVLLRRAFGNLLRNALEASEASGRPRAAHVHGERDSKRNLVRVSVRDQGPGIERAALPRLFQPFYTTKNHGTGLGLAIVQKVVVSHNGQVSAGNHPDGGAEFRVTLPASASQILSQEL
jgi:PAS domain S-box-containing protein